MYSVAFPQRVRRMRVSVIPMSDADHQVAGAVVTFDDVTDQLEAHERVSRSEERFRNLASTSPVAICEIDAAGSWTYVNERWCELSGSSVDAAIGHGWTDAVHPDDRDRVAREWARAAAPRRAVQVRAPVPPCQRCLDLGVLGDGADPRRRR